MALDITKLFITQLQTVTATPHIEHEELGPRVVKIKVYSGCGAEHCRGGPTSHNSEDVGGVSHYRGGFTTIHHFTYHSS